jgi:hypothetical protein
VKRLRALELKLACRFAAYVCRASRNPDGRVEKPMRDIHLPHPLSFWVAGWLCLMGVHSQPCQNYGLCPFRSRCGRTVGHA